MTIYRLYADNGDNAGFWVQHRKWGDVCAQVQSVAGQSHGKLPGHAPLHGKAPAQFHWFDVRSGRQLAAPPAALEPDDKPYASIAIPFWSRRTESANRRRTPVSAGGSKAF